MKCKLFAATALTSALCLSCVFANALEFTATPNFSNSTVTISGTAEQNDMLSVLITTGEVEPGDLNDLITDPKAETHTFAHTDGGTSSVSVNVGSVGAEMAYADIMQADADGSFGITLTLGKSAMHNVYISSMNSGEIKSESFEFTSFEQYKNVVKLLNEEYDSGDKEGFIKVLGENKKLFGSQLDIESAVDIKKVGEILYDSLGGSALDESKFDDNKKLYEMSVIAAALNESKISDITDYLYDDIKNNELYSQYKKFIEDSEYKENYARYLTTKMSGKNIGTTQELTEVYEDSLILTAVRYPDGYMNIKDLFAFCKEKDKLDIDYVTNSTKVYSSLVGEYESIDELEKKYDSLGGNKSSNTGGSVNSGNGGSGSGGSGSGGVSSSGGTKYGMVNDENKESVTTVQMPFGDLDTVMWAYEAVSTLVNKGIVNGKTAAEFAPRDSVKREEFVKMIVLALNGEPGEAEDVFEDVNSDDWFAPYVNYASKSGIVKGIGNDMFGVGEDIKRQDMAAIICNALRAKGIELGSGELVFSDSADIADYAKDAVAALSGAKIVNGNGDGTFNPNGNATRAEAAQIIFNMLGALE